MNTVRTDLVPVVSAYALLAGVVVYGVRHPEGKSDRRSGWRERAQLIAVTVGGGYVCFLAIVVVFHGLIAGQRGAVRSALKGGTFLALVCAVVFTLGSVIEARRTRPG